MVLLKLKAREEQGKEENKVHLVTCKQHKVMCDSILKSANQDLTLSMDHATLMLMDVIERIERQADHVSL